MSSSFCLAFFIRLSVSAGLSFLPGVTDPDAVGLEAIRGRFLASLRAVAGEGSTTDRTFGFGFETMTLRVTVTGLFLLETGASSKKPPIARQLGIAVDLVDR